MKQKKRACATCRFFKDITKFAPYYQRISLMCVAKAARDHPEANGLELLKRAIENMETVQKIEQGG